MQVLNRSFHEEVIRKDNSFIIEHSSIVVKGSLNLLDKFLAEALPEQSAFVAESWKNVSIAQRREIAIDAAVAFQQFCRPKEESPVKPMEDYGIVVDVFKLWRRVYVQVQ